MNPATRKVVLSFAAMFVLGGICAIALSRVIRLPRLDRRHFSEKTVLRERLEKDSERLKLSPAQIEGLRKEYAELEGELRSIRHETNARIDEALDRHINALRPELSGEQRALYEQVRNDIKKEK